MELALLPVSTVSHTKDCQCTEQLGRSGSNKQRPELGTVILRSGVSDPSPGKPHGVQVTQHLFD